ncbi:MAG: CDP-alcohol phosphatidyltransferase family protein [Thermoleophilia bacterium]|nr:CDP-alcohol phosphatidyltransferase family protein [Thermoleophilia bacterium]
MTTHAESTAGSRRHWFVRLLIRIVDVTHVTPNVLTIIGFMGVVASAGLIIAEWWWAAFFVYLGTALGDSLDGTLARYQGTDSEFGAFLDSTLDRAADGVTLGAFAVVFAERDEPVMVAITVIALIATFIISYARSRAETLGVNDASAGLMERTERLVLLGPAIVMGGLEMVPEAIIATLAALSIITAFDRVANVRRALAERT